MRTTEPERISRTGSEPGAGHRVALRTAFPRTMVDLLLVTDEAHAPGPLHSLEGEILMASAPAAAHVGGLDPVGSRGRR